jgi:3'-phosphoadenosine 5'-phosphosulfate sulfotransferase (PAPS reductase)/FAD synthetase
MGGDVSSAYLITEPAAISFSGGRTSGYMLYKILEAHDFNLPHDVKVTFANTGKEMPQTLDFVQACSDNWGVDIVWLEYAGRSVKQETVNEKRPLYDYRYNVVDYNSASRNGEPFSQLISDMGALPNPMTRSCSGQMKIRTMKRYLIDQGFKLPYLCLVGLRGDEPRRAVKMHGKINEQQDIWCPLYVDGKTKEDVGDFWDRQNFDLALPNNNGVTDWGNCDLCFLKATNKKHSIIRERPDLADWWINQEHQAGDFFKRGMPSYETMKLIATDQPSLFDFDDESMPCFCGD